MNDNIIIVVSLVLVLILGIFTGLAIQGINYRDSFVKTKCARYNPDTGKFEILKEIK